MKSKSIVTEGPIKLNATLHYGQILAESYYTFDKKGIYKESSPNTSEILNQWFWPCVNCFEMRNQYVFIGEWNTGLFIDVYTGPDKITIERIIYKPTEETTNENLACETLKAIFNKKYNYNT